MYWLLPNLWVVISDTDLSKMIYLVIPANLSIKSILPRANIYHTGWQSPRHSASSLTSVL